MIANASATAMVCMGRGEVRRQKREGRLDDRRERRLGQPSEPERRHGDAELRRCDVPVGAVTAGARLARHGALGDQLIDGASF